MSSRTCAPVRTALVGLALASAALGVTACSSSGSKHTAKSTAGQSAMSRLTAVRAVVDATSGLHAVITSANTPSDVSGLLKAEGDASHAPAFIGSLTVGVKGNPLTVDVRGVDGSTYAKIGPLFTKIDPSTYGAPDPNKLFATGNGSLASLLTQTTGATYGSQKRVGKEVLQTITGTLTAGAVKGTLGFGTSTGTYHVTYFVTADNQLRESDVVGRFFSNGASNTSYTITLTQYGKTVNVSKP